MKATTILNYVTILLISSIMVHAQSSTIDGLSGATSTYLTIFSWSNIVIVLSILIFTFVLVKVLDFLFRIIVKRFNRYKLKILKFQPLLKILLWAISVFIVVKLVINPTGATLIASLTSVGVAVGLASQDYLKNIVGGLLLITERPFQIGDRIQIGAIYGDVVGISLRKTDIRTLNNEVVAVPNSELTTKPVVNTNSGNLESMISMELQVPATFDIDMLKKIAFESTICSRFLKVDKPIIITISDEFNLKHLTKLRIKAYVIDTKYETSFKDEILTRVKKELVLARAY